MPNQLDGLITRDDIADIAASEGLILDDDERISVLEAMHSIDVQACPGSGKTTLIATKLILLAKKWPFQYQGICVLSHTNVAKNEIIDRLKKSKTPEAQRLLSYPHFIGTIQEFVGKYVAFPFIRSLGIRINHVDTDNCVKLIYANLQRGTRTYIDNRSQYSNVLYDFDLKLDGLSLDINVPTFPNGSNSASFNDLKAVRERMIAEGYFFYKDIYVFAELAVVDNGDVKSALRNRFPCIFIDEMQDTQKYQDELLQKLFPLTEAVPIVQRYGDPDQAIFHGIGGEEPNESFNGKLTNDMDVVINKSHRFDRKIAEKIRSLSFNEVQLETELSEDDLVERNQFSDEGNGFEHTVIIFDDQTIGDVVAVFANFISVQFSDDYKRSDRFSVKVVGGVGNEIDPEADQLKIGHYWEGYDKAKSKSKFKEDSLIEAVRYCRQSFSSDWAGGYKILSDCILKILRMLGKQDTNGKYFTSTSMRAFLNDRGKWKEYRQLIYVMIDNNYRIGEEFWAQVNQVLVLIFDIDDSPDEVTRYLSFSEGEVLSDTVQDEEALISLPENMILHPDGFRIELSTIHGVKGETHDATLVVETKNHCFDLEAMMPYLSGELPSNDRPNRQLPDQPNSRRAFKPNQKFIRQFYVAMSRPKHLLCLAVHSDRITEPQKQILLDLGWSVKELPT